MADVLHLTLLRKWFDEILEGKKKIEYRDIKPYWAKRLVGRHYDYVVFRNGYHKNAPAMKVEFLGLRENNGKYEILLGKVLEACNIQNKSNLGS